MGAAGESTDLRQLRASSRAVPITRTLRRTLRRFLGPRMVPLDDRVPPAAVDAFVAMAVRTSSPVYRGVRIERRTVELDRVYPLSRFYSPARLRAARYYVAMARRRSIGLFEPTCFRHRRERDYHLALPPIVEPFSDGYAVIDGVHRLYALWQRGAKEASIVSLVADDLPPLPGRPGTWQALRPEKGKVAKRRKKFRAYKAELFRPAASYFRSKEFSFYTIAEAERACREAAEHADGRVDLFWCRKHRKLDRCNRSPGPADKLAWDERATAGR